MNTDLLIKHAKRITIMAGHYGSGKTTLAVNHAILLRRHFENVLLCDMDIVNPYFRTKDSEEALKQHGVRLIATEFANSNLDMPSIAPETTAAFTTAASTRAVFDVGGDDSGAVALGQFASRIENSGYEMLLVINRHRLLTHRPEEILPFVREIEAASKLRFTGIANNSNLGAETTANTILASLNYADEVSALTRLPIIMTCVRGELLCDVLNAIPTLYPLTIHTKKNWQL